MDLTPLIPVIIIFSVAAVMIIIALNNIKKANRLASTRRYQTIRSYQTAKSYPSAGRGRSRYVPGQFSEQMELDMRLPYRRFRELYPENRWTYEEYKRMQMQTAFRRSYSSQENRRMVR